MSPRNELLELPDREFKINVPTIFQKLGRKTQQSRKKKVKIRITITLALGSS